MTNAACRSRILRTFCADLDKFLSRHPLRRRRHFSYEDVLWDWELLSTEVGKHARPGPLALVLGRSNHISIYSAVPLTSASNMRQLSYCFPAS